MIAHLKETTRGFTYRRFSRKAGYSSPNFLKLVAEGRRNLSQESIGRFADAFDMQPREREIFELLVHFNQASNDKDRNRYYALLRRRTQDSKVAQLRHDQYEIYSRWYVLPIREMLLLPQFEEDPAWIARHLRPAIRPSEAKRALELLERVGLLQRGTDGRLRQADTKVETPHHVPLAVRNYHRAMMDHAGKTLDELPVEERNVTSLTMTLTQGQYEWVCERVAAFRNELLDAVEDAPRQKEDRDVYVLGFQVFPVSNSRSGQ